MCKKSAWDQHIGQHYARWLSKLKVLPTAHVLEVAPGSRAKVAYGLAEMGFCGQITLLDVDAQALAVTAEKVQQLLPNARVFSKCQSLDSFLANQATQHSFDVVLSNHPLDDFILRACLDAAPFASQQGKDYDADAGAQLANAQWQSIHNQPKLRQQAMQATKTQWLTLLSRCRCAIISAYDSGFYQQHQHEYPFLVYADQYAQALLAEIQHALGVSPISEHPHWLVMNNE